MGSLKTFFDIQFQMVFSITIVCCLRKAIDIESNKIITNKTFTSLILVKSRNGLLHSRGEFSDDSTLFGLDVDLRHQGRPHQGPTLEVRRRSRTVPRGCGPDGPRAARRRKHHVEAIFFFKTFHRKLFFDYLDDFWLAKKFMLFLLTWL